VRMKLMPNVYTVQISSLKTTTVKSGFDAKWAHTVCANYPRRAFVCDKCKK
jgi:hypothetical protein